MSKGFLIGLLLFLLAAGFVVYQYKGGIDLGFTKPTVTESVRFSVIRYEGNIVSSRLIVDGSGRLQSKHRISEESVGIAYYKASEAIGQIQSCASSRYIMDQAGFTQEIITKQVELQ